VDSVDTVVPELCVVNVVPVVNVDVRVDSEDAVVYEVEVELLVVLLDTVVYDVELWVDTLECVDTVVDVDTLTFPHTASAELPMSCVHAAFVVKKSAPM